MATKTTGTGKKAGAVARNAGTRNGRPIQRTAAKPVIIHLHGGLSDPQVKLIRTRDDVKWKALGQDYVLAFRNWPFDPNQADGKIVISRSGITTTIELTLLKVPANGWTADMKLVAKGSTINKYTCIPADLLKGVFGKPAYGVMQAGPEVLGEEPPPDPLKRVKRRR